VAEAPKKEAQLAQKNKKNNSRRSEGSRGKAKEVLDKEGEPVEKKPGKSG
jgi:hypothetical protein